MNTCADCGKDIPKMTLCWMVHLPPTLEKRINTKTVCVPCHDKEPDALEH